MCAKSIAEELHAFLSDTWPYAPRDGMVYVCSVSQGKQSVGNKKKVSQHPMCRLATILVSEKSKEARHFLDWAQSDKNNGSVRLVGFGVKFIAI